jgi:TrkA-N domain/RyR domain
MRFTDPIRRREKLIAPLMLAAAVLLWLVAVVWQVLASGVPVWSAEAVLQVYRFGLGGETDKPLQATLLKLAGLLGQGGAALAVVYAYLTLLDLNLDRLWLRWFARDHVVIVGLSEKALRLATSLKQAGRRVAVIELDDRHPEAGRRRAQGIAVVHGDGQEPAALRQAAIGRARALVCLTDSDITNLKVAGVARELAGRPDGRPPLCCVVHVSDRSLRQIASEAPHYRKRDAAFDGRVLDVADLAARELLRRWAPDRLAPLHKPDAPPLHVLVVGADALARALVVNLAVQAHYAKEQRPVVTLLDPRASRARAALQAEYPALPELVELRAQDASLPHLSPAQLAQRTGQSTDAPDRLPPPLLAFVTLEPDAEALAAGMHLARLGLGGARPRIVVCIPPDSKVMAAVGVANPARTLGFSTFDRYAICTEDGLIGERLDRQARERHERYLARLAAQGRLPGSKPTQQPWAQLDEMVKASNRRQVAHEAVKRRAFRQLGCGDAVLEQLAETEHRRWMADLRMAGWSLGPRYDWALRQHDNLVPYAALDEATRDFDRDVVRQALPARRGP